MRTTTFTYKGAVFEVAKPTVRTTIRTEYVANLVFPGGRTAYEWKEDVEYANFITTVTLKNGDPGFVIPGIDDPAALRAFYEPFMEELPGLRGAFVTAREQLTTQLNDPDLTPGVEKKEPETPPTDENASVNSETSFAPSLEQQGQSSD